jgi:DNA polymerase-3 subunit epsilon
MKQKVINTSMQFSLDIPADEVLAEKLTHPTRTRRKSSVVPALDLRDLDSVSTLLNASPDFRVIRRLKQHDIFSDKQASRELTGVYVDCETTGLGLEDKIIEVGLVRFSYDADSGEILRTLSPERGYSGFEDPGHPLSEEIKRLTGIEDYDLSNQRFDDAAIASLVADAQLIIAHNSGFDRPRFEQRFPIFSGKRWACSFKDVDWSGHGITSAKLEYLAYVFRFFFDGHRAVNDCFAALEILSKQFPDSGESVMQNLLETARKDTWRHFANPARYQNEQFRGRGYRWCGKERAASWYKDYPDKASAESARQSIRDDGIAEDHQEILCITALDRYSFREMGNVRSR